MGIISQEKHIRRSCLHLLWYKNIYWKKSNLEYFSCFLACLFLCHVNTHSYCTLCPWHLIWIYKYIKSTRPHSTCVLSILVVCVCMCVCAGVIHYVCVCVWGVQCDMNVECVRKWQQTGRQSAFINLDMKRCHYEDSFRTLSAKNININVYFHTV